MASEGKKRLRGIGAWMVRYFGQKIVDQRTGELLGRAFIFCWGGRVMLIGYDGDTPVRPVFLCDSKVRYWRQTIGFESRELPDFPRESINKLGDQKTD